jgi:Cell Wall Hydrolase
MVVSRSRSKGARFAPFGFAFLAGVLMPNSIGYQDLASLIAQQPEVSARWRAHMIASPFGTIHAATFSFPRPIGTAIPEPENIRLASFDPDDPGLTGGGRDDSSAPLVFPAVNRTRKGDFLGYRTPPDSESETAPPPDAAPAPTPASAAAVDNFVSPLDGVADGELPIFDIAKEAALPLPAAQSVDEIEAAVRFEPFPQYDISMSLELHPQIPVEPVDPNNPEGGQPDISLITMANDSDPTERMSRLFFGRSPMNTFSAAIEPWAAGEEPVFMAPRGSGGVTTANKGEVTGDGQTPKSPADRLKLAGKARDKAERCLANAVYFEAGREPVRGQIGVAQVVLNRVFSGFYPHDVCGVIYQNANRHLACQFTFACDGIPDVVTDQEVWARAKRIAKATLDGKVWLPEIGKATHYHANYVHPYWVRSMRKLHRIGAHIFYRPRGWGDGADAPSWGSATATTATASQL